MRTFFVILVLGMFAGTSSALAWTGPSAAPPSSNTLAPVNIGTSDQVKNGGLSLNSLAIFGNTLLSGTTNYLNFGTVAGVTGYGIRNNSGIVEAKSSGASWGKVFTTDTEMTQTRDDAGLQGSAGARSGFFQTSAPVNYPAGATSWWHLIEARHTNTANNYALQIAGSFFDQNLYFRKLNNSPSTPWSKVVAQDSTGVVSITGNVGVGTTTPAQKLSVAGTIYSSSGGFQFPDGTVQASAAGGNSRTPSLQARESLSTGTAGGACPTAAWGTRTLNSLVFNTIAGASLASNRITLPAGNYWIEWSAPGWQVGGFRTKLYNVTTGTDIAFSETARSWEGGWAVDLTYARGKASVTLSATSQIEVRMLCQGAGGSGSSGLGYPANISGVNEYYTEIIVWK